jgi:glycosyltransferase involved in cell wall biosynthesis
VICLDLGGPGFHIKKDWGEKIDSGRPDDVVKGFSEAMARLAENPSERLALGKAGRQRAAASYSWDSLGARMNEIYSDIISEEYSLRIK